MKILYHVVGYYSHAMRIDSHVVRIVLRVHSSKIWSAEKKYFECRGI